MLREKSLLLKGRVCYFAEVFAYLLILFTALDFKMQAAAVAENLCCFRFSLSGLSHYLICYLQLGLQEDLHSLRL